MIGLGPPHWARRRGGSTAVLWAVGCCGVLLMVVLGSGVPGAAVVADTVHHYFQPVYWSVTAGVPVT